MKDRDGWHMLERGPNTSGLTNSRNQSDVCAFTFRHARMEQVLHPIPSRTMWNTDILKTKFITCKSNCFRNINSNFLNQ